MYLVALESFGTQPNQLIVPLNSSLRQIIDSLNSRAKCTFSNSFHFRYADTTIDIDGSGPLAPFKVRCEFFPDGRNITYVDHLNMEATKVDGFEEKGSFSQKIYYDANMEMMEALINR